MEDAQHIPPFTKHQMRVVESSGSAKEYKRNRARLIQKIYKVDPLTCPRCSLHANTMHVVVFLS